MNVLVWFKRDLRVEDHPALSLAAELGPVLPVYVVEPDYWALPDASARQWAFTAETLDGLRRSLGALGAPLVVRSGDAVEVLSRLCRQNAIKRIVSHQEIGNAWTYARDRRVAAWARETGITWTELPQCGVRRGAGRGPDWASHRQQHAATTPLPVPRLQMVAGLEPGVIPPARALRLADDPCPHRQPGGRAAALALLDSFLAQRGQTYRRAMSAPLTAERSCSRLSPYLATGAISGREVEQITALRCAAQPGAGWAENLRSFQSRLVWRDHFTQKLEDEPMMETRALHRAADALPGRQSHGALFGAWARGETGLPYLDACIRYLDATGWLNFRARAMLVSVATYHMWLDWRRVGATLARRFTDYDPGIHWPQVQMQSGMSGINRLRIYNPVKQGQDHDPAGLFTRRWVPELSMVPDAYLHCPWKWPEARRVLGHRYPEPVIDVASAARHARETMGALRNADDYRQSAADIIARHASPDGNRHFVNDRASRPRRTRPPVAGQLSLEF